jgi:hypothetical protein
MTIGISKDDLLKIDPWQYDNQQDVLDAILDQCTELNPWLPIEQAPKHRRTLLYFPSCFNEEPLVIEGYSASTTINGVKPTHYQELPADPE